MKTFVLILVILGATAGGYGGYRLGEYLTTQNYQRAALANGCGVLNVKTLAFSWREPETVTMAANKLPALR